MPPLTILHGCCTIQLTRGFNALLDDEDHRAFSKHKWFASRNLRYGEAYCYACRKNRRPLKPSAIYLHRAIIERLTGKIPHKALVDFKNRDVRDNRRDNLRLATVAQDRTNMVKKKWRGKCSSRYKGVVWHKHTAKWRAMITISRKQYQLGGFTSEIAAARAYNAAALKMFGAFARVNQGIQPEA